MDHFSNIIWVYQSLKDLEQKEFTDSLNSIGMFKIKFFRDIESSIKLIKEIQFEDTFIIISSNLYEDFINIFKENLNDIYIIPKIIIFGQKKEEFINNHNSINDQFYNFGGIKTTFNEVKEFIIENNKNYKIVNMEETPQLVFEYIESEEKLLFPILYRAYIEVTNREEINKFTKVIFEKYHKKSKAFQELLGPIKNISNIPIQLLSKYYARLYTEENSHFYSDLNKDLRENKRENYIPFIQVLYEGVKLKSLPLGSTNILYRGSQLSSNEIEKIKNYLNNKKINLPAAYVFSKSFLSFSKEKRIALNFLNSINCNNNLSKVLFILDKDDLINHNISSHADIEKISFYPNEKEVLFFPFSSFEIKSIQKINEKRYEIKLLYLGKYLDKLKSKIELINNENFLPNSEFKKCIIEQGLIKPKEIEKKNIKSIFKKYNEFTNDNKINSNDDFTNLNPFEILNIKVFPKGYIFFKDKNLNRDSYYFPLNSPELLKNNKKVLLSYFMICNEDKFIRNGNIFNIKEKDHFYYVIMNDLENLKKCYNKNKYILGSKDKMKRTLLHYSVMGDYFEISKFLLKNGINFNEPDYCNCKAIFYSSDKLKNLLEEYGDDRKLDFYNETPDDIAKGIIISSKDYKIIDSIYHQLLNENLAENMLNIINNKNEIIGKRITRTKYRIKTYYYEKWIKDGIMIYHGTKFAFIESIMYLGLTKFNKPLEGHIPLGIEANKIKNWAEAIFGSPSIFYASRYSEIIYSDNEEWYIIVEAVVKPNSFTEHKSTIYNYNFKRNEPKNLEYRINSTLKSLVDTGYFETNVDTISILFIKKKELDNMNDYSEQFIFKYNEYKN